MSAGADRAPAHQWLADRSGLALLASLLLLVALHPWLHETSGERLVYDLMFTAIMLLGLWTAASHPRQFRIGIALLAPALVFQWIPYATTHVSISIARTALLVLFMLFTTGVVSSDLFAQRKVSVDTISCAVSIYLLLAVTWALVFSLVEMLEPGSFLIRGEPMPWRAGQSFTGSGTFSHFLYLSFVTITTLGYGDVLPTTDVSKMFAMMEAFVGQVFIAVVIARLVGLEIAQRR